MPAPAERSRNSRGVEFGHARADDTEDSAVHLHETDKRAGVRQVDDLVRQVRHAVDVVGPANRRDEYFEARDIVLLNGRQERIEERPLPLSERCVEVVGDHVLAGAVAKAPRERLSVPERDAGIAERAGVLVDPERENSRLQRRHLDLTLGQDRHHRRREGPVFGTDDVVRPHPVELVFNMVVEQDDFDLRIARDALEVSKPSGMRRLHDDEPLDGAQVDTALLRDLQLLRV